MLGSYAIGVLAVVAMSVAWVGVQLAWRSVFPGDGDDPDTLAGRMGCKGCGCGEPAAGCRGAGVSARQREEEG